MTWVQILRTPTKCRLCQQLSATPVIEGRDGGPQGFSGQSVQPISELQIQREILSLKIKERDTEMTQSVKYLLCKHKGLSPDPPNTWKAGDGGIMPVTPALVAVVGQAANISIWVWGSVRIPPLKHNDRKAGKMTQRFRVCAALAEDQGWFLGPTLGGLQLPVPPAPGDLTPSASLWGHHMSSHVLTKPPHTQLKK